MSKVITSNNVLDIKYKSPEPFNHLSNFYPNCFNFQGEHITSMEGLLQRIKFKSEKQSRRCLRLYGATAKKSGKRNIYWRFFKQLYWKGKPINRFAGENYMRFLSEAYTEMFSQNPDLLDILLQTGETKLKHSIGIANPKKTVLTEAEFIFQLNLIRKAYKPE